MEREEMKQMIRELLREMEAELGQAAARAINEKRRSEGKAALEL